MSLELHDLGGTGAIICDTLAGEPMLTPSAACSYRNLQALACFCILLCFLLCILHLPGSQGSFLPCRWAPLKLGSTGPS